jgi:hypothetical protein
MPAPVADTTCAYNAWGEYRCHRPTTARAEQRQRSTDRRHEVIEPFATITTRQIRSADTFRPNFCLNIIDASKAPGAGTEMRTCDGSTSMQFAHNPENGTFRNVNSGLCLQVDGTNDWAKIVQQPCNSSLPSQQFASQSASFGGDVVILNPKHVQGKCLDVALASRENGATPILHSHNGGENQRFTLPLAPKATSVTDFDFNCPNGTFINQVSGRSGWWMAGIGASCSTGQVLPYQGGPGGDAFTNTSPYGYGRLAVVTNKDNNVDSIRLHQVGMNKPPVLHRGGVNSIHRKPLITNETNCPSGHVISGIKGQYTDYNPGAVQSIHNPIFLTSLSPVCSPI